MRRYLLAGTPILFLLFSFSATAQFNVNSLFAPIDFSLQRNLIESISGTSSEPVILLKKTDPVASAIHLADWRTWTYVENFEFGKDRGSIPMITDLNSLHPYFRDKVTELIARCKAKGIELAVVETFRTHAKQREYKNMGRKYTTSRAGQSKHQYGLAIDVVPVVNSKPVWNNASLWRKIGVTGERLGLRWGGRWNDPYDPGHFEWTGGLTSRHLSTGRFPVRADFAERYPCLDEDLKTLQSYWAQWETSQETWTRKNKNSHNSASANSSF